MDSKETSVLFLVSSENGIKYLIKYTIIEEVARELFGKR